MNKTVTINISGIIFHIEEDAYERLSAYLAKIKSLFAASEGGMEIMGDIESRIAELLQAKLNAAKQVIVMGDVEEVISVMGKPEDFSADQQDPGAGTGEDKQFYTREKIKKRLFRNPDDKAIGGVCSGLAAYLDIDTVWVRLAMFILIFFGGISLWVYIVLWIIMPLARTTADKFAMRGEPANINTIFRSFKEEADDVKQRFQKYGKEYSDSSYGAAVRSNASMVLGAIFNILGRLFGLFLVIIGCTLLFAYVASLLGISFAAGNTDLHHWRSAIFSSPTDYTLGVFAFVIVVGIPVLMLVYTGVKLLFRIRYSNRWLNLSLGFLWMMGLLFGIYITVRTVKQFNESARVKETIRIHSPGDTIVIRMNAAIHSLNLSQFDNKDDIEHYLTKNHSGYYFGENNHRLSVLGHADLNVVESQGDSVELAVSREARGFDKREANENARNIQYSYRQEGNQLIFDEIFLVNEDVKFRAPELKIKLMIPKGKVVYFDRSVKYLLDDVENTTNTWDGNMVGRRWVMTGRGLTCIDCDGLDDEDDHQYWERQHRGHRKYKEEIRINEEGIHVNGDEAEVKIDEDGIRIHTPGKDYHVGGKKEEANREEEN